MAFHDRSPKFRDCVTIREHGRYVTVSHLEETFTGSNLFDASTAPVLRVSASSCAGLILNQMAYNAGRNTRVRTVPPKVPPIKVYASVPQNTEWVSGMKASI